MTDNTSQVGVESEAAFASWLEDALRLHGWRFFHSRPARTRDGWRTALSGDPGFPDYVATRNGDLLFIELKSQKGRVEPEQQEWLDGLQEVADRTSIIGVYVWRASDRDTILEVLR